MTTCRGQDINHAQFLYLAYTIFKYSQPFDVQVLQSILMHKDNLNFLLQNSRFNPLPDDKFLDSSKLKELTDDNFKFDENGRKLSKQVENTVGKGEIARYGQFLLFPQCFSKACFPGTSKGVIVWEWAKRL